MLVAGLLEFKAFSLFSFLFGMGIAIQAERAAFRGVNLAAFLVRRFLVLLVVGVCHLVLIWNGDILVLYAVCGLVLIPFLRLPPRVLLVLGAAALALPHMVPWGMPWPSGEGLRAHVGAATRIYSQGGFLEILKFRWYETRYFMAPLVWGVLPKTVCLMFWGVAAWRSGVVREPERHQRLLRAIFWGGGAIGGTVTALQVLARSSGRASGVPGLLQEFGSYLPLAFAYAAGVLLWLRPSRNLAAVGQMALTNYLLESVILGFLFYGYGFGLFGRLGSAVAAGIGIALYGVQVAWSRWWLERFRFGPFEWLWRSMTYGRWQPLR
jgi:uncharacterized protein